MFFMSNISEKPEDRGPHRMTKSEGHIPMSRDSFLGTNIMVGQPVIGASIKVAHHIRTCFMSSADHELQVINLKWHLKT